MTSCIVLAAGESSRFGTPKALASFRERTVIQCIQNTLINSQVDEIIIVLGAHAARIKPSLLNHKKVKVVHNKDYKLGQTSSFQAALPVVHPSAEGMLLWPVDFPSIKTETVDRLLTWAKQQSALLTIPTYQNKKGHPPFFSVTLKEEFLRLDHSEGLNQIARRHADKVHLLEVDDGGVVQTFNTPDELKLIS